MTREENYAAFDKIAQSLGFKRLNSTTYDIPGGGRLEYLHMHYPIDRYTFRLGSEWRLRSIERESIPALAALHAATETMPMTFGEVFDTRSEAPARAAVPKPSGFGSGDINDTKGT